MKLKRSEKILIAVLAIIIIVALYTKVVFEPQNLRRAELNEQIATANETIVQQQKLNDELKNANDELEKLKSMSKFKSGKMLYDEPGALIFIGEVLQGTNTKPSIRISEESEVEGKKMKSFDIDFSTSYTNFVAIVDRIEKSTTPCRIASVKIAALGGDTTIAKPLHCSMVLEFFYTEVAPTVDFKGVFGVEELF